METSRFNSRRVNQQYQRIYDYENKETGLRTLDDKVLLASTTCLTGTNVREIKKRPDLFLGEMNQGLGE